MATDGVLRAGVDLTINLRSSLWARAMAVHMPSTNVKALFAPAFATGARAARE